jgi:uncharacterized protein
MSENFIIDAHAHIGLVGLFFTPESSARDLLRKMDRLGIRHTILAGESISLAEGAHTGISTLRRVHDESQGRLWYLGVFDPRSAGECLLAMTEALAWPGFAGVKLHPSLHHAPADDPAYERAWRFAAEHDLPILVHSWSLSDYNPVQRYSTPERFEAYVRRFPQVRLVLGHAGGRGLGRREAVRMVNKYPHVYVDFAGDIFCNRLLESLVEAVPSEKILFGSDFPWIDPAAQLSRVLLAEIDDSAKRNILVDNAVAVYRVGASAC